MFSVLAVKSPLNLAPAALLSNNKLSFIPSKFACLDLKSVIERSSAWLYFASNIEKYGEVPGLTSAPLFKALTNK